MPKKLTPHQRYTRAERQRSVHGKTSIINFGLKLCKILKLPPKVRNLTLTCNAGEVPYITVDVLLVDAGLLRRILRVSRNLRMANVRGGLTYITQGGGK